MEGLRSWTGKDRNRWRWWDQRPGYACEEIIGCTLSERDWWKRGAVVGVIWELKCHVMDSW